MKAHLKIATIMFLIASLLLAGTVYAQEPVTPITPTCEGDGVSGTVVAIDEQTNTVTVDTGEGLCTVVLDEAASGHPIAVLLGQYFGNISLDDFVAALGEAQVCVVFDAETETWSKAENCDAEGAVSAQVLAQNEDGSFTLLVEGEEVTLDFRRRCSGRTAGGRAESAHG